VKSLNLIQQELVDPLWVRSTVGLRATASPMAAEHPTTAPSATSCRVGGRRGFAKTTAVGTPKRCRTAYVSTFLNLSATSWKLICSRHSIRHFFFPLDGLQAPCIVASFFWLCLSQHTTTECYIPVRLDKWAVIKGSPYTEGTPCFSCSPAVQCPNPENPPNGKAIYTSCAYNSVVSYECKQQFRLIGDSTRRCGPDRMWSGEAPVCKRECLLIFVLRFG